jgi:hypothetical protein
VALPRPHRSQEVDRSSYRGISTQYQTGVAQDQDWKAEHVALRRVGLRSFGKSRLSASHSTQSCPSQANRWAMLATRFLAGLDQ